MVVQLEKKEALAQEAKLREKKRAQKSTRGRGRRDGVVSSNAVSGGGGGEKSRRSGHRTSSSGNHGILI